MDTIMIPLNSLDSIGDSLSAITLNFDALDSRTYYLNLSASNLFDPLKTFIDNKFLDFSSLISTVSANSSKWVDLKTVISTNSSAWIKPIVYIHPTILPDPANMTMFCQVTAAFNQTYPVFNNEYSEYPEYVENQKAYIYYYTYKLGEHLEFVETEYSNMAHCECPPSYTLVVFCTDSSSGSVGCDNGTHSCGGCATSCNVSRHVACYYENNLSVIDRYMLANIDAKFADRYEKDLTCAIFQIKNCEWVFMRYI